MSNKNSDNPVVGRNFQQFTKEVLCNYFGEDFIMEPSIPMENKENPKVHKFDLSNRSQSIVVECKCYTWTDSGNVPSAKIRGLNEALFFFSFLPSDTRKILCMAKSEHPKRNETLAQYYVRINEHLLRDVQIFEIDTSLTANEKPNILK